MSRHIQRTSSWADWSHTELAKSTLMEESTEQLQFWGRCTWVITLGMWALTKEQCVIVACCQSGVWVVNSSTKETRGRVKGWKRGTYAIIHKAQMTTNMCSCHTFTAPMLYRVTWKLITIFLFTASAMWLHIFLSWKVCFFWLLPFRVATVDHSAYLIWQGSYAWCPSLRRRPTSPAEWITVLHDVDPSSLVWGPFFQPASVRLNVLITALMPSIMRDCCLKYMMLKQNLRPLYGTFNTTNSNLDIWPRWLELSTSVK